MNESCGLRYGRAHGPLGFPMTDRQAFALDALLKTLPRESAYRYRKAVVGKGPTELMAGERSDVSWISEESPDRDRDVVLARGMNDAQFQLNPIVTLNHSYDTPPVGRSLWRKRVRDGALHGIKAKTHYPPRPSDWETDQDWPPDVAFGLVQADLLRGKSIGFLPTKVHAPTDAERDQPGWRQVELVIDEWILLEYACVYLPAQQNAVVNAVSKEPSRLPPAYRKALGAPADEPVIPFLSLETIAHHIRRRMAKLNPAADAARLVHERIERHRGRI